MKITAVSVFIFAALVVVSASGIGAPTQAIGSATAPLGLATAQSTPDARDSDNSGCSKWRQFYSSFGLKPARSDSNQRPDSSNPVCWAARWPAMAAVTRRESPCRL